MLGLVVDGNADKDENEQEHEDEKHSAELQQQVATSERSWTSRASHCRWWPRRLLAIFHQ